ncbi:ATP-binding protein [Pukyongiella litopenaei]|uniref:histidine kinase n=1 Tax=Pukyongiella litopenaei TaxID=2605946 RepID=A0A2S0MRB4_9RHOB|nr:ATP-binding protein [Pukyongiella litopenaei]AVO38439.1 histidine kinase [Pukyongiella litopenaei]
MKNTHSPLLRSYHSWIANESLEDYSLRYAARSFRKWSPFIIANTALGGISFLALEAIGAAITLSHGFANAFPAILVAIVFIFIASFPIAYYSSRYNIDMDLLTRGAGFGYIGSTITSLVYATFTFIFFALEGAIMAQALLLLAGIPLVVGYLISSIVIIPITFMGVTMINRVQLVSQPVWVAMQLLPFAYILYEDPETIRRWTGFIGTQEGGSAFNILSFGSALGILFALSIQIGEQVDYLRFLPEENRKNRSAWWAAVILAGPGWILVGGLKILFGSFLAVLVISAGQPKQTALEPVHMYIQAYEYVFADPGLVLAAATIFVIISQVKINITNAYAGSLAWSNFFSRVTLYHPGRVVWLLFNIMISLLLMMLGVFDTLEVVLAIYSVIAAAWVGAIFADLAILKPLGISPSFTEFKRAYLPDFNPVGCGAMALASLAAFFVFAGFFGELAQAYAAPMAFFIALLTAVLIGVLTGGRYYIARPSVALAGPGDANVRCELCGFEYERPDMAHCTFYQRPVCSLCCSLEAHCHDMCKSPQVAVGTDFGTSTGGLRAKIAPNTFKRLVKAGGIFLALSVVVAAAILITYRLIEPDPASTHLDSSLILFGVFLALLPLLAVGTWWIVLSHESRELAERDLLISLEELEKAQNDLAANERLAAIGEVTATVSHELRNPLGTLVNSADLLRRSVTGTQAETLGELDRLQRNAWRCVKIIDDLLDFSRNYSFYAIEIELDGWVTRALADIDPALRARIVVELGSESAVLADSERLRQAFVNILNNAAQACDLATSDAPIRVATFSEGDEVVLDVTDRGIGMTDDVRRRIFEPLFSTNAFGVGLGMPLVRRIIEHMGGTVRVTSESGTGTTVQFRLPRAGAPEP